MKIIRLQAENIKRLTAVSISPDGALVQITGKNGNGKTSVLDSIWWAICGADHIQAEPIRRGADKAKIRLTLGTDKTELIVTRTFKLTKDGDYTTKLTVENAKGARYQSPQVMLDGMIDALTFDPLSFMRKGPRDKLGVMRRLAPGIAFDDFEMTRNTLLEDRRDAVKLANSALAAVQGLPELPAEMPEARIDEKEALNAVIQAGDVADAIRREAERRNKEAADIMSTMESASKMEARAAELRAQADEVQRQARQHMDSCTLRREALDALPDLESAPDVATLRAALESATATNKLFDLKERREAAEAEALTATKKVEDISATIKKADDEMKAALAAVQWPVDGLSLSSEGVLWNGFPLEQASDAAQLRVAIAIAANQNPALRVIRVRDGSLLDEEGLSMLATYAAELDLQVWIERVDSSGAVGFVIEDGHLKGAPGDEEEAAAEQESEGGAPNVE